MNRRRGLLTRCLLLLLAAPASARVDADEHWTKPPILLMSLWGVGNTVVIYLAALPVIVLFFFTQKRFIEGIAMTGLKG